MTTAKGVNHSSTVAAMKAERELDKAQALREYAEEKLARQANMERLRALRLAKECAELNTTTAPKSAKKATASQSVKKTAAPKSAKKAAAPKSAKKKAATQTDSEPRITS